MKIINQKYTDNEAQVEFIIAALNHHSLTVLPAITTHIHYLSNCTLQGPQR